MAELVTGEAVALDIRVARLASRALALLLDVLVQLFILDFVVYFAQMTALVADEAWAVGLSIVASVLVIVGYPAAMETLTRGRTLGKMALGLRVVADDGGPVRFRQALVRGLAGSVEFWLLFGSPALVTSLFNQRGKRLGDVFAGTIVIQDRVPASAMFGPVAVMPPQLADWGRSLELSRVSDGLALTARQYLSRFWELLPEVRDAMGQRITDQILAVVSPPPPPGVRPEILLSAVLAERRHREERRLAQRRARRTRLTGPPSMAPAPGVAMAGASPRPPAPVPPPPFSDLGPGRPRFLPPADYRSGPYQEALAAGPQRPHPQGPPPGPPPAPPSPSRSPDPRP